jgi:hypothetical protein
MRETGGGESERTVEDDLSDSGAVATVDGPAFAGTVAAAPRLARGATVAVAAALRGGILSLMHDLLKFVNLSELVDARSATDFVDFPRVHSVKGLTRHLWLDNGLCRSSGRLQRSRQHWELV